MTVKHVVVDGSNLATEGRTLPSLRQLDEAVRAFIDEFAPENVIVVVDATFPNRIDEAERATFEEAMLAGEMVTPPAGVIGRGDAFLLQIADRANAVVLSNDSFQEFHGQYAWLFEPGRLFGGKPVPHVGWVFMGRSPVRGPTSRRAISDAKKAANVSAKGARPATGPEPRSPRRSAPGPGKVAPSPPGGGRRKKQAAADSAPPSAAPADEGGGRSRRKRGGGAGGAGRGGGGPSLEPYNAALQFIEFVAAHPVGSVVEGEVERFSSHGAYIDVDGTTCYLPLKHLGDPPPRSAREVLSSGERYQFVVHAFDTPRRGVDLAMQGVALPVEKTTGARATSDPVPDQPEEERVATAKKGTAKKAAAKKSSAKKAPARKATAKKSTAKKAPAKKATAKKSTAKKATAKKSTAKKATAKKATAKKSTAKKATAKKATAKKSTAKKSTAKKAPAKRATKRS